MTDRRKTLFIVLSAALASLLTLSLVFFFSVQITQAANHDVDVGDSIQDAIVAANPGDTIRVAQGRFTETLVVTKSLSLMGGYTNFATGARTPGTTVLVGKLLAPLLEPNAMVIPSTIRVTNRPRIMALSAPEAGSVNAAGINAAGIDVTIDGFEITGGINGGIHLDVVDDSRVVIHDNYIHDNTAINGGGILANVDNRSKIEITENVVMSNTGTTRCGGVCVTSQMSVTVVISGNQIEHNTADLSLGGLAVQLRNFGDFTLNNNMVVSNTVTGIDGEYGGMYFTATANTHGSMNGNQVLDNRAEGYAGGYVYMSRQSSTTFYANKFADNYAYDDDNGGLYIELEEGCSLVGDNLEILNNRADDGEGGASIEANYASTIDLPNTKIIGNSALDGDYGGAYFEAYDNSVIRLPKLVVTGNYADGDAGGVYLDANDGNDTIIATDSLIISNTAADGDGGGAYIYVEDGSLIDMSGSNFAENSAGEDGGGLYLDDFYYGSTVLLNHTTFMTNTADSDGGGAYFDVGPYDGSRLEIRYAVFISNTANDRDGGGLYIDEQYYGGTTLADHGTYISNTAGGDGGAVYLVEAYDGVHVDFNASTFKFNAAKSDGGALYTEDCYDDCWFSISDSTFYSNTADYGGAIYIEYGPNAGSFGYYNNNTFEDNASDTDGGAIYLEYEFSDEGSEAYMDDNEFIANNAGGYGGAFFINDEEFAYDGSFASFSRNRVISNTAEDQGGGLYMSYLAYDGSTTHFNDNVIVANQSEGDGGGAFFYEELAYDGSVVQMNRNTIADNVAVDGDGGGIYLYTIESGSQVEFRDNIVTGNVISSTSDYDGGGIYIYEMVDGSTLWMTGNKINDNVATGRGGGLFWDDIIDEGSQLHIEDNQFLRNQAGSDGGGCHFDGEIEDGASLFFNRNLVNNNVALDDAGACFFDDDDDDSFDDGSFIEFIDNQFNYNTAADDYGALIFDVVEDGTRMRFYGNQVIGNRAGISGTEITGGDYGGVRIDNIDDGSHVDLRDNLIMSNTAYITGTSGGRYGALYLGINDEDDGDNDNGLITLRDNQVLSNTAQHSYAGVYVELEGGSRLVMDHNLISANTAITDSGGLYITGTEDSQYYLTRNQILNNSAGFGGGVWIGNGDDDDPLWGISENNLIAGNKGSGVYLYAADFHSTNDTIADNFDYGISITGTGRISQTLWLANTIVWGHTNSIVNNDPGNIDVIVNHSDIQGGWPSGTGNINLDPLFLGGGDYHLQGTSPAVDKVDPATAPYIDLDGIPRPVPIGGQADMGAYEFHIPGVVLAPDLSVEANPGQVITLTHTLTNSGNAQDNFALSVVSAVGWDVKVMPAEVTLPPDGEATVYVIVTVPGGLSAGDMDNITVRADSTINKMVVDSALDEVTVALVPALTFTPDRGVSALVNSLVVYEHTLTNDGNGTDTFQLNVASSLGWSVSLNHYAVTLAEGESAVIEAWVRVASSAANGDADVTTVTATSLADGAVSASVVDTTIARHWPYNIYLPLVLR